MSQAQIYLFIVTSLVIIISPGQDMVLAMSRAISQGSRAGIITAAGVTIFYFAYLPQFISSDAASPRWLLLALGMEFAGLTFFVKGPVGFFAGILSSWLRQRPAVLRWIDRTSGAVLILLGIKLALEERV